MDRRGVGAAGVPGPEPARPDPLGVRTSAKQDTGNRPISGGGADSIRGRTPFLAAGGLERLGPPRRPVEPLPRRAQRGQARAGPAAGRPDAVRRPRDEPAPATRAVTLPEPVEAPKADADAAPKPADSAAVDPAPAEGPIPEEPAVVATSASAAPELPGLTLDQEPVVPTPAGADESVPVPVPDPDLPPARGELPQARVIDTDIDVDNDPVLAGRPRLRLVPPGVEARRMAGRNGPPTTRSRPPTMPSIPRPGPPSPPASRPRRRHARGAPSSRGSSGGRASRAPARPRPRQLGPNRATSRSGGTSSIASRPTASTNRRSVNSRCSATSGYCSATSS